MKDNKKQAIQMEFSLPFCAQYSLEKLKTMGMQLKHQLYPGRPILFSGPLGAGKTTLIRLILQGLNPKFTFIPSPSFSLMISYDTPLGRIWHMDLYRIEEERELDAIGIAQFISEDICFI